MEADSLQSEAEKTHCNYLLNREITHVLTAVGEKISCAWMSVTHSVVNRPTSLPRESDVHLMPPSCWSSHVNLWVSWQMCKNSCRQTDKSLLKLLHSKRRLVWTVDSSTQILYEWFVSDRGTDRQACWTRISPSPPILAQYLSRIILASLDK